MARGRSALVFVAALQLSACRTEDPAQTPAQAHERDEPDEAPDETPDQAAEQPALDGPPLTREEVRLVVRSKMAEVRACFAEGLARDASIGGRVLLSFTIEPSGRASIVEIAQDEVGAEVAPCLVEALGRWQFPRPRDGRAMAISYPFVFSSEQSLRAAGLPRVEGTVKPKAVGEVFDAHRAEADECLPEGAKGMVALAFLLGDEGRVTKLSIIETSLDEAVAACVGRAVSSWRFPASASGDEARVNHELWW